MKARNVVFAPTNAIDPHRSIRRYDKTLRARLGWRRFWFSPTALLRHRPAQPGALWGPLLLGFVAGVLGLLAGSLLWQCIAHWPALPPVAAGWPAWMRSVGPIGWLILPAACLSVGWLLLRYWDWRTLARFNDLLYDLIHTEHSHLETSAETVCRLDPCPRPLRLDAECPEVRPEPGFVLPKAGRDHGQLARRPAGLGSGQGTDGASN